MRDLVHHGVANDVSLPSRRRADPLDRAAEDADAVRKVRLHRAAVGERDAFVETEELTAVAPLVRRRLVLDDDLDVAHAVAELRREVVERARDESREAGPPKV